MQTRNRQTFFRLSVASLAMLLVGWFPALADSSKELSANPGQAVPAVPLVQVQGVRYWCQANQARVTVDLETTARYTVSRLSNPERVYLDLYNTRIRPGIEMVLAHCYPPAGGLPLKCTE